MRKIKFKTWIKSSKRMAFVTGLCYQTEGLGVEVLRIDGTDINKAKHQEFWWKDKEAILLQFTGLCDKNGKEIYEGDLFEHYWRDGKTSKNNPESRSVWVIVWSDVEFGFLAKKISGNYLIDRRKFASLREGFEYNEIIGNIYENKELINVDSKN